MSKFRNCLNCGAALQSDVNKCPYCGTSYLDICGLKLDGRTPIVLKFNTEVCGHKATISTLVTVERNYSMAITRDTVDVMGGNNQYMARYSSGLSTDLELHFRLIPDAEGGLLTIEAED